MVAFKIIKLDGMGKTISVLGYMNANSCNHARQLYSKRMNNDSLLFDQTITAITITDEEVLQLIRVLSSQLRELKHMRLDLISHNI